MRLARIIHEDQIVTAWIDAQGSAYPLGPDMDVVGADRDRVTDRVKAVRDQIATGTSQPVIPERWLPPIRPGKIIGVALNNSAFAPMAYRYFDSPSFFMKAPSALIGHGEAVIVYDDYGLTHPEAELACVIGRHAHRLTRDNALDAVFGYTIINDVTSVGLKDEDSLHLEFATEPAGHISPEWRKLRSSSDWDIYLTYHFRSKCTDTFGPIGPWITTADEVADPDNLAISAWLGDRLIAQDSTANLSFSIAEVLVHLTRYATLEPGDIVHFGTAVDPARFALREANILTDPREMRIEIEGLGTLRNPVRCGHGE